MDEVKSAALASDRALLKKSRDALKKKLTPADVTFHLDRIARCEDRIARFTA